MVRNILIRFGFNNKDVSQSEDKLEQLKELREMSLLFGGKHLAWNKCSKKCVCHLHKQMNRFKGGGETERLGRQTTKV